MQIISNFIKDPRIRLIRFHKPIGTILLLIPVLWMMVLASSSIGEFLKWLPVFIIGGFAMRSAGCIVNDMFDVNFDKQVERTKARPLAKGDLSKKQAFEMLGITLSIALACFILIPGKAKIVALCALVLVMIYPLAKRFMRNPQIFLGFTFNLGIIMVGYTLVGYITPACLILYLAAVFWTIGYDTIYALQDIEDDIRIGVKSMAIQLGQEWDRIVLKYYGIAGGSIIIAGANSGMNVLFYAIVLAAMYVLFWQVKSLKIEDKRDIESKFESNALVGLMILIAFIIGRF